MLISVLSSTSPATTPQSTEPVSALRRCLPHSSDLELFFFPRTQTFLFSTECIQEDGDKD